MSTNQMMKVLGLRITRNTTAPVKRLNKIFSELCSQKEKKIDFFTYKTPNKRIP
jgi:hypothetical protein